MNQLTTKLVLNLSPLRQFGDHGKSDTPLDVSPFSFIVLSNYSDAWMNCRDIVDLKPDTTFYWELEVMGNAIPVLYVSGIKIVFKLIGFSKQNANLQLWEQIFNCDKAKVNKNGTLELEAEDFKLTLPGSQRISVNIKTQSTIGIPNNLTYSIYMNFTDGMGHGAANYFFKIDPLIKNNSDVKWP